jgi:hypothetical protein
MSPQKAGSGLENSPRRIREGKESQKLQMQASLGSTTFSGNVIGRKLFLINNRQAQSTPPRRVKSTPKTKTGCPQPRS